MISFALKYILRPWRQISLYKLQMLLCDSVYAFVNTICIALWHHQIVVSIELFRAQIAPFHTMECIGTIYCFLHVTSSFVKKVPMEKKSNIPLGGAIILLTLFLQNYFMGKKKTFWVDPSTQPLILLNFIRQQKRKTPSPKCECERRRTIDYRCLSAQKSQHRRGWGGR